MKAINLLAVFCLFISFTTWSKAVERTVNNDIVVTKYETVVMEQGKRRVFPLFHIKNQGERTYTLVSLRYTTPKGLSPTGEWVELNLREGGWASIILKPGREMLFNPSLENYTYLEAGEIQAETVYSANYWFEFSDSEGHNYKTPAKSIEEFVKVVPYNDDIVVTKYETVVMEQGKSRVFPLFHIKNQGERTYTSVSLHYTTPKGLSPTGEWVQLNLGERGWASITLKPGQETFLNPSLENYTYLEAAENQAKTVYSADYWFEFSDSEGHHYKTPAKRIEEFVKVVPYNHDIVVAKYETIVMEQGKRRVFPLFHIKNQGERTYTSVSLHYTTPKGLSPTGEWVQLNLGERGWASITLKPGQETFLNPSLENYTYLEAAENQAKTIYSADYWFEFSDDKDRIYKTPSFEIESFAVVVGKGESAKVVAYRQPIERRPLSEREPSAGTDAIRSAQAGLSNRDIYLFLWQHKLAPGIDATEEDLANVAFWWNSIEQQVRTEISGTIRSKTLSTREKTAVLMKEFPSVVYGTVAPRKGEEITGVLVFGDHGQDKHGRPGIKVWREVSDRHWSERPISWEEIAVFQLGKYLRGFHFSDYEITLRLTDGQLIEARIMPDVCKVFNKERGTTEVSFRLLHKVTLGGMSRSLCPRCGLGIEIDWGYCPHCGVSVVRADRGVPPEPEHPPLRASRPQTPQEMLDYLYRLRTTATPRELLKESFEVGLLDELNKKVGEMGVTMTVLAAKNFEAGLPNFLQLMIELGDVTKLQVGFTPEPPPGKKARNVIPASELRCSIDPGIVSFAYDDSSGWLLGSVTLRALDESREPAEWVELKPASKEQEGLSQIFGSAIRILVSAIPLTGPIVTAGEEAKKNLDLWFGKSGDDRRYLDENKYDIVSTPVFPYEGRIDLTPYPSVTKIVVDLPIGFEQSIDLPLHALIQVKLIGRRTWGFITPGPHDPARTEIDIVRRLVVPVEVEDRMS